MVNTSFKDSSLSCTIKLIMLFTLAWVSVSLASVPILSTALDQVTLQITGANMTGTMSIYYYNFTALDTISDVFQSSAVLSTFQYNTVPDFKFRLSLPIYSSGTNRFNIGVQVLSPCNFAFLKFYIIYITQQSSTYLEINSVNFTCTIANGAIGTNKTELLNFPTRLNVAGTDSVSPIAFLSSILLQNSAVSGFAFTLNTPQPTVTGYTATVTLTTPATITEIFVTLLIIKNNLLPEQQVPYLNWGYQVNQAQFISTSGACSNSFGINASYGGAGFNRNCTLGLTQANEDYNTPLPREIDFDSTAGASFTSCVNTAQSNTSLIQQLFYGVVCFYKGSCPNTTYYFDKTVPDCKSCSILNASCLTCNISKCFQCSTGFYPLNLTCVTCTLSQCTYCLTATVCAQCLNTSYVNSASVCAPCTDLPYCTLCNSNVTCLSCVNNSYAPDQTGACTICYQLSIECLQCSNYFTCTHCNTSFYVAGGGCFACASSISYCNLCSNSSFCSACQTGYFISSNTTCTFCGSIFPHCGICSSNASCTTCQLGYYPNNATSCFPCTLTGCVDCSSNTTCVQCQSGYYLTGSNTCQTCTAKHCINCPTSTSCLTCETDFILTGNSCICPTGYWEVTNVCTNVIGCVTAVKISGVSTCLFCNSLGYFIISGTTCKCKTGYQIINSVCTTVCGDGYFLGSQQCDDGNTASGDGCSPTCILQPNYNCYITAKGYQCVFTANFTISLQYIWRDPSSNSGTYYFSISPTTPNFNKQSLLDYFVLTLSPNTGYQVTGYTYLNGIIQCNVDFTQDIQNLQAQLYLSFDPCFFNTNNFTYSFLSTGTNAPLIVSGYTSHISYLTTGTYVALGLAGVILIFSVIFEKMIAIETINYLQLLVFCKLVYIQEDLLLDSGLSSLRYIAGYNQIGQNLAQTHTLSQPYRRLSFNNDFFLNFETGLLLMGISLVVFIIFHIYRWRFLSKYQKDCASKDDYRLKEQTLNSKARFIYERLIFLVACIILFQAIAALRIQARALDGESQFSYFLINLLTLVFAVAYTLGVLTYEVLNTGKAHEWMTPFCSYSPYYVGYYVVWALIMSPIMAVGQIFLGIQAIFICGGILLINLIVLVIWRPYNQIIHNIGIILNHVVVLGFLGFQALMSIKGVDQSVQFIVSYTLLGLILSMQVVAMIRLYFAYRPPLKEVPKLMRNEVAQMEEESKIVIENLEKDFLSRVNNKQPGSRQHDDDDFLRKLKSRLKKENKESHISQIEEI